MIETSIALDAFVFVVNKVNPIKSLKVDEIENANNGRFEAVGALAVNSGLRSG